MILKALGALLRAPFLEAKLRATQKNYKIMWNKLVLSGGIILGISALLSKGLGFWRDRLIIQNFSESTSDVIFAAFRIPDFFFYLFVGATINVLLIPRLTRFKNKTAHFELVSSFFWGVSLLFGLVCVGGFLGADFLAKIFASGFTPDVQSDVAELSRYIFISVFLLSISGVFGSILQFWEKFFVIAITPLIYMGSIALAIYSGADQHGITAIGYGAIIGALLHTLIHVCIYTARGGKLLWIWGKPKRAWKNFLPDFSRRTLNNSAFQINQSVDTWIASFLMIGSVTAFTLGTTLGHFLLSVIGFSVANAVFPKLSKLKKKPEAQWICFKKNLLWIFVLCIPTAFISAIFSETILKLLFDLEGNRLWMTKTVFFWTVISLPFACALPLCTRLFFANDDTHTPLYATISSLTTATVLALILCFWILPEEQKILGLAIGNFTANTLGFIIMFFLLWQHQRYERQ